MNTGPRWAAHPTRRVLRLRHRARAGVGGLRRVHAPAVGAGPATAAGRRDPRQPAVRHQAAARDETAGPADRGRAAGQVGGVRRGLRPQRGTAQEGRQGRAGLRGDHPVRLPGHHPGRHDDTGGSGRQGRDLRAPLGRERIQRPPLQRLGDDRHRHQRPAPADPPADLPAGPADLLPVLGAAGPAGHHDLLHHHRRPPLASRSRPPLLPVKRDLSFTAALLVLLPAFRRFLPGVVPSGRGCSSRAGGPCARGARASAARRR